MLGVPGLGAAGKVFTGTVPYYGKHGGVLAVYDMKSRKLDVHRNLIPDQSIVSLIHHEPATLIIGGTSISGGLGVGPKAKEAVLFGWDDAKRSKAFELVPVPGAHIITGLMIGPDGHVWGVADGTLFVFDPAKREVLSRHELLPVKYLPDQHAWKNAYLETSPDGTIYGVMQNKLFRLDPATKQIAVLRDGDTDALAIDRAGRVYFKHRINMFQYTPAKGGN